MKSVKLIVAYPQPKDATAFEKVYQQEHVPMAIANLHGKTKIVATKILQSPQGTPQFYCVAEVHFPSIEALQSCADSAGGKATLAHAVKISSGGPPVIMIAEEDTFTFWHASPWMRKKLFIEAAMLWMLPIAALHSQSIKTGPDVGQPVPAFSASDQDGRTQTLKSVIGPKGAMLVFFRSADWWPFCKIQLVELEQHLDAIRQQGLGVAAISYDSVGVLKSFAERQHITYPLLSDPDSKIIGAYGILNETSKPGTPTYGIPYPGVYIVNAQGMVVSKFFEDDYKDRVSAADILAKQFGGPLDAARGVTEAKHLQITTAASNGIARPGLRIALSLDIELGAGMHVYAPGVQGYIPIDWRLDAGGPAAKRHAFEYPSSEMLRLEAIGETVPVYRGHIRIRREITFGQEAALKPLVGPTGEVIVKGTFRYQACDDTKCYIPEEAPLEWRFKYEGLDRQRAPSEFQRRSN